MNKNLRKRTESGIKWSVIDQIFKVVVSLLVSIFLARLIDPKEFGLFAIVTVSVGFLAVFKDFGIGAALIHRDEPTQLEIDSIFWFNILLSLCISIVVFFGSYVAADFYDLPQIVPIMKVMSLIFFISSLGLVPDGLIRKHLDFKGFFIKNAFNVILSGSVAVIFAYKGFGVWALVIQVLSLSFLEVIISFGMIKWRPKRQFSWDLIKPFLRFSFPLLGENTINYWVRNGDNLLIGKYLGEEILGYYSRAYNLMLLPVRQISGAITRVMFPSFSIIKNDKVKVWDNYCKIISLTAFITFPLMGLLFVFGDEFILFLYGEKWIATGPIFKSLCFLGAIQSIGVYCGSIFSSQGETYLQFKLGLFTKPFMLSGIIFGLYIDGIKGVVVGYTLTSCIAFFFESYFLTKVLGQKTVQIFYGFYKEFIITGIILFISSFIKSFLINLNGLVVFVVIALFGLFFYLYLSQLFGVFGLIFIREKLYGIKKDY